MVFLFENLVFSIKTLMLYHPANIHQASYISGGEEGTAASDIEPSIGTSLKLTRAVYL